MSLGKGALVIPGGGGAAGGGTTPIFSDDFSSDTRANYTYLSGASTDFSVAAGELAASTGGVRLIKPTAPAARKSSVVLAKIKAAATGRNYFGPACKIVDANNFVMAIIDTDTAAVKLDEVVGGSITAISQVAIPGFARDTYYWLLLSQEGKHASVDVFTSDPEVNDSGFIGSAAAPLGAARATASGVGLWGNNPDTTAWKVDLLKAWAYNAHPFDF